MATELYRLFQDALVNYAEAKEAGDKEAAKSFKLRGETLHAQLKQRHEDDRAQRQKYLQAKPEDKIDLDSEDGPPKRSIDHLREKEAKRNRRYRK
jgi:hypothetical protein